MDVYIFLLLQLIFVQFYFISKYAYFVIKASFLQFFLQMMINLCWFILCNFTIQPKRELQTMQGDVHENTEKMNLVLYKCKFGVVESPFKL